jgi:hypothetical protein
VSSRDKQALAYCTGVRAILSAEDNPPTVEFSFSSNPFFSNSVLRRCLGDDEADIPEVTTDIKWKDTAHKLVVKVSTAAGVSSFIPSSRANHRSLGTNPEAPCFVLCCCESKQCKAVWLRREKKL